MTTPRSEARVPVLVPGLPVRSVEHVTIPNPTDVNPGYFIDQHTKAYADPRTDAFQTW